MTEFELKIYDIVRRIPAGKVASYGAVARTAGNVRYARAVGNTMHKNPAPYMNLAWQVGFSRGDVGPEESEYPAELELSAVPGLSDFQLVPCHRVVDSQGRMGSNFGLGGPEVQAAMLRAEGVDVKDGRVDLLEYGMEF